MPIQINNVTVIDDDRNFNSPGITTVGSGTSIITIDGNNSKINVGTAVTIDGKTGNISIAGTIRGSGFNVPVNVASFSPADQDTNVGVALTQIVITFDQTVALGSTGKLEIRTGGLLGTVADTFGVGEMVLNPAGKVLTIDVSRMGTLPFVTSYYPILTNHVISATSGNFVGINSTAAGSPSYYYVTKAYGLGDPGDGGYQICSSGGTRWIVAPDSAINTRTAQQFNDAINAANTQAACGDWFVPSLSQMQNPGYQCRQYWQTPPTGGYWTNTGSNDNFINNHGGGKMCIHMDTGNTGTCFASNSAHVATFRCFSY